MRAAALPCDWSPGDFLGESRTTRVPSPIPPGPSVSAGQVQPQAAAPARLSPITQDARGSTIDLAGFSGGTVRQEAFSPNVRPWNSGPATLPLAAANSHPGQVQPTVARNLESQREKREASPQNRRRCENQSTDEGEGAIIATLLLVGLTIFLAAFVSVPTTPLAEIEIPSTAGCGRDDGAWIWWDSSDPVARRAALAWCRGDEDRVAMALTEYTTRDAATGRPCHPLETPSLDGLLPCGPLLYIAIEPPGGS